MNKQETKLWIAEITDTDSEIWSTDIEGNSREDVIADGMKCAKEEGLDSFRIGQCIPVPNPNLYVDSILEDVRNQVYAEFGEVSEGYIEDIEDITKEQEKELEDKLNEVFHCWIEKYRLEPTFYTIENEEVIQVE